MTEQTDWADRWLERFLHRRRTGRVARTRAGLRRPSAAGSGYAQQMVEWYGPDHDAYRMLFAGAYSGEQNA
jgi:hypothetical protein